MKLFLQAVIAAAALLASGCSRETTSANNDPRPARIEQAPDPLLVETKHPEQFPLALVETRRIPNFLTANCAVSPDVERTVHVNSLTGGRVTDIRARLGDDVSRGQVLLVLSSQDLAGAISDYKKAVADEALARKALERARTLFEHGATARKDLDQAEDAEQKAEVDVATAASRIRILGGDVGQLSPIVEVRSPIAGTIVEQNTTGGEGVKSLDNSPSLFTVADLSRVWLLCDVYENDLAQVRLGDFAEVRLNAYPDRPLRARVSNIGRILDPNTRAAKVRLEVDNRQGQLRPGMFATAKFTSQGARPRLLVPASAILRLHDKDWVFLSKGGGRFRRTEIQAGAAVDGGQEVLAGKIKPGDQIVANALQFSTATEQM